MSGETWAEVETGEIGYGADADEARRLTDRIKVAVEGTWLLVVEAFEARVWISLGYGTWDEYCTREFGTSRLRLPREERQEVVASLRESGLSIRAIVAATGDSYGTVHNALSGDQKRSPEAETEDESDRTITGTDGRKYPASPSPAVLAARARRAAEAAAKKEDEEKVNRRGVRSDHYTGDALREQFAAMSEEGFTSQQIAAALNLTVEYVRSRSRELGVTIQADLVTGRSRRLDSDRIVSEMVATLEATAMSVALVNRDELGPEAIEDWATSLNDSLKTLNRFHKQLKEMTQ